MNKELYDRLIGFIEKGELENARDFWQEYYLDAEYLKENNYYIYTLAAENNHWDSLNWLLAKVFDSDYRQGIIKSCHAAAKNGNVELFANVWSKSPSGQQKAIINFLLSEAASNENIHFNIFDWLWKNISHDLKDFMLRDRFVKKFGNRNRQLMEWFWWKHPVDKRHLIAHLIDSETYQELIALEEPCIEPEKEAIEEEEEIEEPQRENIDLPSSILEAILGPKAPPEPDPVPEDPIKTLGDNFIKIIQEGDLAQLEKFWELLLKDETNKILYNYAYGGFKHAMGKADIKILDWLVKKAPTLTKSLQIYDNQYFKDAVATNKNNFMVWLWLHEKKDLRYNFIKSIADRKDVYERLLKHLPDKEKIIFIKARLIEEQLYYQDENHHKGIAKFIGEKIPCLDDPRAILIILNAIGVGRDEKSGEDIELSTLRWRISPIPFVNNYSYRETNDSAEIAKAAISHCKNLLARGMKDGEEDIYREIFSLKYIRNSDKNHKKWFEGFLINLHELQAQNVNTPK